MRNLLWLIAIYLIIINIIGFFIMAMDKHKARKHKWRIPEATLFIISIIGGSLGTLLGMYAFRHKTKHKKFVIGMPVIFILHLVFGFYLFYTQFGL